MQGQIKGHLDKAIRSLQIADHMTYVTYPLVNEKRLLLKIFDEISKSIINCVSVALIFEGFDEDIDLNIKDFQKANVFVSRFSKDYELSNSQSKKILEIIGLNEKHSESAMEFVRKERVVIMSDNLSTGFLDIRIIKEYLLLAKEFLVSVRKRAV